MACVRRVFWRVSVLVYAAGKMAGITHRPSNAFTKISPIPYTVTQTLRPLVFFVNSRTHDRRSPQLQGSSSQRSSYSGYRPGFWCVRLARVGKFSGNLVLIFNCYYIEVCPQTKVRMRMARMFVFSKPSFGYLIDLPCGNWIRMVLFHYFSLFWFVLRLFYMFALMRFS